MQSLRDWFETPLGRYLLEKEQAYFDEAVADVFGFNAVQLGLESLDFLRANRIPLRFTAGTEVAATLRADFRHLPVESNCIDLAVLPHVLEFSEDPHQILREVQRVLLPEGQVIISGFNPRSLWGLRRLATRKPRQSPWHGNFISLPRLKDWLALLDLEVTGGGLGCYVPPFRQEKWLERAQFLEAAGDRWWPISGGVYFIRAVKRVHGMRVIKPNWNDRRAARESLASVARRLNGTATGTQRTAFVRQPRLQDLRRSSGSAAVLRFPSLAGQRLTGPGRSGEEREQ
jgi:SAM-dependent methyltransferase